MYIYTQIMYVYVIVKRNGSSLITIDLLRECIAKQKNIGGKKKKTIKYSQLSLSAEKIC